MSGPPKPRPAVGREPASGAGKSQADPAAPKEQPLQAEAPKSNGLATRPPGANRGDGAAKGSRAVVMPGADAPGAAPAPSAAPRPTDVLYVHSPTESGGGYHVIRQREERIEVGELRPMREGMPLSGELVKLIPRAESDRLFDVDVLYATEKRSEDGGPAQVATDSYRRNWDKIFGGSPAPRKERDSDLN